MKIERLEITTANLKEQLSFYKKILELETRNITQHSFEVKIGYSVLKIRQEPTATPYHIAFHIPAHREEEALAWLKERVEILKNGEEELVDFSSWNAKSMYFYDAGKNVLEFISRGHCFLTDSDGFSAGQVLGISEIGVATTEVRENFDFLQEHLSLHKFTGDYERFCATGDDEGLFILIDRKRKDWFPSNDKALASEFSIRVAHGSIRADLTYTNESLHLNES